MSRKRKFPASWTILYDEDDDGTVLAKVPVSDMFLDTNHGYVYLGGRVVPQGDEGPGFQRNAYDESRSAWADKNITEFGKTETEPGVNKFSTADARPIEGAYIESGVNKGLISILDGGLTTKLHHDNNHEFAVLRIHLGLTRAQQAEKFHHFDADRLRLRNWQLFVALVIAQDEEALAIRKEILPYHVDGKGPGTLQNTGSLFQVHRNAPGVLSRTCKSYALTPEWGGYSTKGWDGGKLDPILFLGLAVVHSLVRPSSDVTVREMMTKYRYTPKDAKGKPALKGQAAVLAATADAQALRRKAKFTSAEKVLQCANFLGEGLGLTDAQIRKAPLFLVLEGRGGINARTAKRPGRQTQATKVKKEKAPKFQVRTVSDDNHVA